MVQKAQAADGTSLWTVFFSFDGEDSLFAEMKHTV